MIKKLVLSQIDCTRFYVVGKTGSSSNFLVHLITILYHKNDKFIPFVYKAKIHHYFKNSFDIYVVFL